MALGYHIGIIYTEYDGCGLTHDFFSGVLNGFKSKVEELGYNVSFLNSDRTSQRRLSYREQAEKLGIDGVLIANIDAEDPEVTELAETGMPFATVDKKMEGASCIFSDNAQGIRDLAEYIITMGHKRIGYIKGDSNYIAELRLENFLTTCRENGVVIPEEYIRPGRFRDMANAAYQTENLLRLPTPPTCIIYSDDYSAIGGINIIRARGLHVPVDMSVAGYDGIRIVGQYEPKLTTVRQDTDTIGRTAAEKLADRIEGRTQAGQTENVVIPSRLEKGRTIRKLLIV